MIRAKFSVVLVALVSIACIKAWPQAPATQTTATQEIQMTAKRYEFNPATITVKQGERVKLTITALDRDHGFELKAFHINQHLKKGVPRTVEFTADQGGAFSFKCSDFCGIGHSRMKGKLVVEPASPGSKPQ